MKQPYGLLVCGGLLAANLGLHTGQAPLAPTSKVDVAGVSTRYQAIGLQDRKPGQPAVIFLSGFGSPLEGWAPVLNELMGTAPLLAYDRPGVGQSSYDGNPLTPERVCKHLHELLRTLNLPPPYILVGHSWGGVLLLHYASRFPGEVVGSVFADPTNFLMTREDHRRILSALGMSEAEQKVYAAQDEEDSKAMRTRMPPGLRAELEVIERADQADPSEWAPPQPPIPTSIILAGRLDPRMRKPPGAAPGPDQDVYFKAERALTLRQFRDRLANIPHSTVRIVPEAAHAVHRDVPSLVASEIRRVLSLGQSR